MLKGTVTVILSDPPCKGYSARITTVTWKNVKDTVGFFLEKFALDCFKTNPNPTLLLELHHLQRLVFLCISSIAS